MKELEDKYPELFAFARMLRDRYGADAVRLRCIRDEYGHVIAGKAPPPDPPHVVEIDAIPPPQCVKAVRAPPKHPTKSRRNKR